jgi:hypothetical protein
MQTCSQRPPSLKMLAPTPNSVQSSDPEFSLRSQAFLHMFSHSARNPDTQLHPMHNQNFPQAFKHNRSAMPLALPAFLSSKKERHQNSSQVGVPLMPCIQALKNPSGINVSCPGSAAGDSAFLSLHWPYRNLLSLLTCAHFGPTTYLAESRYLTPLPNLLGPASLSQDPCAEAASNMGLSAIILVRNTTRTIHHQSLQISSSAAHGPEKAPTYSGLAGRAAGAAAP